MTLSLMGMVPQMMLTNAAAEQLHVQDALTVAIVKADIQADFDGLSERIGTLEDAQARESLRVVDSHSLQNDISGIQIDLEAGMFKAARTNLGKLESQLSGWQQQFDRNLADRRAELNAPPPDPNLRLQVPILIYHKTPGDFERQLQTLQAKGYTAIDLEHLLAAFRHQEALPAKQVVITFDDGFSDQMRAFELLQKYGMKATYYIATGGNASRWCIGPNRRYGPAYNCGDGYLNWDQIRQLDRSGLITIAGHTVDHVNLAALSAEAQRFQLAESKRQIEAELGHGIRHLAYPYGGHSALTQRLAKEAGYATAVSTIPGTVHTADTLFKLHRTRSVYQLP
jgi:peptidoglycan/xylan/chitin deacetylase (PgdA/CDA1 family)